MKLTTKIIIFIFCFCLSHQVIGQVSNKAYGDNMKIVDSVLVGSVYQYVFAIYSGDVNQDGIVESSDYSQMENAVTFGYFGYIPEDLTGDGIVESADYSIIENAVTLGYFTSRPY